VDKYQRIKGQQLAAIFFLGCLLFNYPILTIFSKDNLILGIPVLYAYLFAFWAALIGLIAIIIEWRK